MQCNNQTCTHERYRAMSVLLLLLTTMCPCLLARSLGPPAGHRLALFIDDIHLPAKEPCGAQPALEMLRLLLDRGGLYQR